MLTKEVPQKMDKEMMKGSIDLLLLSLIEQRDLYGYEMTRILKRLSDDAYEMSEGTLYAALKRMERKAWIEAYWHEAESGQRRKYYQITKDGEKELKAKKQNWQWMNDLVKRSAEGLQ
jgi:DNA-binding PadR family transcriptional regulator